tara:strand:- start:241 stop:1269 length:1029 start_codon:yes stop_codon:yes gene_type:complete
MSSMLDQAIVDAKALKEAAIKSAESTIVEKYSQEIREAVDTMLNKEEVISEEEGVVGNMPMAASDVSEPQQGTSSDVIELDFQELEQMIDQELASEEGAESEEMTDRHEFSEEELEGEKEELQENEEIDLNSLFEDEEIKLDEEAIEELAEKLTLDFQPVKSGNLGMPDSQKQMAYEEAEALNAHADEEDEASDEIPKEVGKLRETVETLEAEKKELQEKLQSLQANTKHIEDVVLKLKDALNETSVQNAKLLYTNEALNSNSLNGRQKAKLVEAISNAKSVEEAKVIFETLQSTVSGTKKESPKTLSEAVSRKSTLLPQTKEAKQPADPRIDRMRRLAGLN